MKSLWDDKKAQEFKTDLELRVYTSRLLGQDSTLVLHGGGNTSVKSTSKNLFGETEDILYVKGSGWDLATIEAQGFAPVKMDMLLKMAELKELDDTNMVKYQRMAMTVPIAPNPSVEAILHALIPFKFVDHTHTNAVVTITNTANGEERIRKLYGKNVLVIPYIMPGFVLAKLIYNMTRDVNWNELEGMVLLNHGLFTFNDDAKKSYEKTIELVDKAERYLQNNGAILEIKNETSNIETLQLAKIRKEISILKGCATISVFNNSNEAINFSKQDIQNISQRGPLTPDHVIRTKRLPAIITDDFKNDLSNYISNYKKYFEENKKDETLLNPAPNFAILKNNGTLSFGKNTKEANIIKDINGHTFDAILKAEKLGGYKALSAKNIFEVEYWELEQLKLKKSGTSPEFSGKVAIVTGGASGIGLSIANTLNKKGCAVVVLDINPDVQNIFKKVDMLGIKCDLTSRADIQNAIDCTVKAFGGIDIVVSNAGIFTPSENIDSLDEVNLTSYQQFIKDTIPYLHLGIDPAIVIVASKNFQSTKLEEYGIRINTVHTNSIYDKNMLTSKVLKNIANLVCAMAGEPFAKTTGSQVAIDGGSDRII